MLFCCFVSILFVSFRDSTKLLVWNRFPCITWDMSSPIRFTMLGLSCVRRKFEYLCGSLKETNLKKVHVTGITISAPGASLALTIYWVWCNSGRLVSWDSVFLFNVQRTFGLLGKCFSNCNGIISTSSINSRMNIRRLCGGKKENTSEDCILGLVIFGPSVGPHLHTTYRSFRGHIPQQKSPLGPWIFLSFKTICFFILSGLDSGFFDVVSY